MANLLTPTSSGQSLRFFPVSLDSIDNRALAMDLYLKTSTAAQPVLYRATGIAFSSEDRARLVQQGVEFLYVPVHQHKEYQRALAERLDNLFKNPDQNWAERGRAVRAACTRMIEEVLLFPGQPEAISAVAEISRQFVRWSAEDHSRFSHILDMSAHDFYTATHMVNTGVACGLLMHALRPGESELQAQMIEGAMLHDVGKRDVPDDVLNKQGKLEPAEWELLKKHPLSGYDELKAHPDISDVVLEMTRDHHERVDGTGYPNGLTNQEVGFAARVCAVVDVFDAVCSSRPYRGPTPPLDTLQIMRAGRGTHFDSEVVDTWCRVVERMVAEDPDRAVPSTGDPPKYSLGNLVQAAPGSTTMSDTRDVADLSQDERRRHARIPCSLTAKATFIRQGKEYPVKQGEWIAFRVVDISRGGAQLRTPWPLTLNDVLVLQLRMKGDEIIQRHARVVRVRAEGPDDWVAGVCFIDAQ